MTSFQSHLMRGLCLLLTLTLIACGSGGAGNDTQKPSNSSAATSSSISAVSYFDIKPVFPLVNSNLGGQNETILKLIIDSSRGFGEPMSVSANGVTLFKDGVIWKTEETLVPLETALLSEIEIIATTADGESQSFPFIIGNSATSIGESIQAIDIFFPVNSENINAIDENKNRFVVYDFEQSMFEEVYAAENGSNTQSLRRAGHYLEGTSLLEKKSANETSLVLLDNSGELANYFDAQLNINEPSGFFIDHNKDLLPSEGELVAYVLDNNADNPLVQWYLSGPYVGENYAVVISTDESTRLSASYSPLSVIQFDNSVLIAREFSNEDSVSIGSLIKVDFTRRLNSYTAKASHFASFERAGSRIIKPTAMALNHDQTTLYIADQDKIWAMDLTQESKPFELLTSSSIIPGKKGQGPRLGSSITAMELHPEHDVLYIAAGAQGIMAVDLETGDRITVAK